MKTKIIHSNAARTASLCLALALSPLALSAKDPKAIEKAVAMDPANAAEILDAGTGSFKLAPAAMKRLGVVTMKVQTRQGILLIPKIALVQVKEETFVFVQLEDRVFQRVKVTTESASRDEVQVTKGLLPGRSIVTQGSALLRVVELDLLSGEDAEEE